MEKNPFSDSIESMEKCKEAVEKAFTDKEEVKDGTVSEEEAKSNPAYRLFNGIADTSIEVLNMPSVAETMKEIGEKLGEETSKKLTTMLVLIITNVAFSAVNFYDDLLKEELNANFNEFGKMYTEAAATINAHTGVLEVLNKKVGDIENSLKEASIKEKIK